MSASSRISERTRRIFEYALRENEDDPMKKTRYVEPVKLFPLVKYETSTFFTDRLESKEQKEEYSQKVIEVVLTTLQPKTNTVMAGKNYMSDVESTFDDSDRDKDYKPSSQSESDTDYPKVRLSSEKKKRFSKKIKKVPKTNLTNKFTIAEEEHKIKQANKLNVSAVTAVEDQPGCSKTLGFFDKKHDVNQKENMEEAPNSNQNHIFINKKGKRLTLGEKTERDKNKHPLKEKCKNLCRRKCEELDEETRKSIWNHYWSMDYTSRRKWLYKHVTLVPVKRKNSEAQKNRVESRLYTLPKLPENTEIPVCRLTFLNTLGYNTDSVITELVSAIKSEPCGIAVKERRGINPKPKTERNVIMEHIESFNPCISHYRRTNAPNVKYLPRELTIQFLFDDFILKHPGFCKIEMYRKVLKEMNISLCQPKSDVCEECSTLQNILKNNSQDGSSQEQFDGHRLKASQANTKYKEDAQEAKYLSTNSSKRIYSMDLQKVMLLPIMPQSKTCFFTSRLVVFNQTFATLNKNDPNKSFCVVWHEALSGRKAESLVDAMIKVITRERDVKEFVFWCDNCSSQNKNWVLFTSLIGKVNMPTGPDKITIRYLTKGHTHMSADGIHGNIEKKIGRHRTAYDFEELLEIIASSRKKLEVLQLTTFHAWRNKKRTATKTNDPLKGFLLNKLVEVCFIKGKDTLHYKRDFKEEYQQIDFLQKKAHNTVISTPEIIPERGINANKKEKILKELIPLMPENRKLFWQKLPDSNESVDLVVGRDPNEAAAVDVNI